LARLRRERRGKSGVENANTFAGINAASFGYEKLRPTDVYVGHRTRCGE
jgi:hypothetical protein